MPKPPARPRQEKTPTTPKIQTPAPQTTASPLAATNGALTPQAILQLQRTIGNRAVGRLLRLETSTKPPTSPSMNPTMPPLQRMQLVEVNNEGSLFWRELSDKPRNFIWAETVNSNNGERLFYIVKDFETGQAIYIRFLGMQMGANYYEEISLEKAQSIFDKDKTPHVDPMPPSEKFAPKNYAVELEKQQNKGKKRKKQDEQTDGEIHGPLIHTSKTASTLLAKVTNLRVGKLHTDFVAHVVALPTTDSNSTVQETGEGRYRPKSVIVKSIILSDSDRPPTQFQNQERHTVAWTLARNAMMGLAGRSVFDIINYFGEAYTNLKMVIESREAEVIYNMVKGKGIDTLQTALTGEVPVSVWQQMVASLIKIYMHAYQLSASATFKDGDSEGSGEGHAMGRLRKAEITAQNSNLSTTVLTKSISDAQGLLDLVADPEILSPQSYVFAVNHWKEMLVMTFPALMKRHGIPIVSPILNKKVKVLVNDLKDQEVMDEEETEYKTVGNLLEFFNFSEKVETPQGLSGSKQTVTSDGVMPPEISIHGLSTAFNANISLIPTQKAVAQPRTIKGVSSKPKPLKIDSYKATDVDIRFISLSNKDRPQTKYKEVQRSHTVAWTLVRHHVIAFGGQSLAALLKMLLARFNLLKGDVEYKRGVSIIDAAINTLTVNQGKTLPVHEWEALASRVLVWYAIAYQVAQSASYTSPEDVDKPKTHGESHAMQKLRDNEYLLESEAPLKLSKTELAEEAAKLFDAFVTTPFKNKKIKRVVKKTGKVKVKTVSDKFGFSEKDVKNAYHHWESAMQETFPTLWGEMGNRMKKVLLTRIINIVDDEKITLDDIINPKPPKPLKQSPTKKVKTTPKTPFVYTGSTQVTPQTLGLVSTPKTPGKKLVNKKHK